MKIQISKNGAIKLTAKSKRDSLQLLKFMYSASGKKDQKTEDLIKSKEDEILELEKNKP
jgi:hypothetical protein